jgi:hypothetical protein
LGNSGNLGNFWEIFGKFLGNFWEIFGKFLGNFWEMISPIEGNYFISHDFVVLVSFRINIISIAMKRSFIK